MNFPISIPAYRQSQGLLGVKFPTGSYVIKFGDAEKTITVGYSQSNEVYIIDEWSQIFALSNSTTVVGYEHVDTKERITVQQYTETKLILEEKCIIDDGDGEPVWASVPDRHAWELHRALWKPITKTEVNRSPEISLDIKGEFEATHRYIVPVRKLTGDLTNTVYQYAVSEHIVDTIKEILSVNGFVPMGSEPPLFGVPKNPKESFWFKGNDIEFSKIIVDGNKGFESLYLTSVCPGLDKYKKMKTLSGSFSELTRRFETIDADIRSQIMTYVNRNNSIKLINGHTIGEIVNQLETIRSALRKVEPHKRSASDLSVALSASNAAIEILTSTVSQMKSKEY